MSSFVLPIVFQLLADSSGLLFDIFEDIIDACKIIEVIKLVVTIE